MSADTVDIEARISKAGQQQPGTSRITVKDFKGKAEPDWCPGCGDFGVLSALKQALVELAIRPHEAMVISGIGCSSNLPGYISTYGMHTLHGRALSVATGAQMANHELKIIVTGGDGDGYGIGGNHFIHSMRRNVDLTYIVMNNQIYGLTTGQLSPTSVKGMATKSTPFGSVENPLNPIPLAIAAGATYVARGYTGQVKHLVELIKGGIQHKGFSLIDAFSPCVTFNHENSHEFFKQRTFKLEDRKHDPTDFAAAMKYGYEWGDEIAIGLFWRRTDLPSLDQLETGLADGGPLARRPLGVSPDVAKSLIRELM
jgi:2-oxoglutarate/2-oxoacid ferredoxin oxidoreductase subunit beta